MTVILTRPSGGPGAVDHIAPYTATELTDALVRLATVASVEKTEVDSDLARELARDIQVVGIFLKGLSKALNSATVPTTIAIHPGSQEVTAGLSVAKPSKEVKDSFTEEVESA